MSFIMADNFAATLTDLAADVAPTGAPGLHLESDYGTNPAIVARDATGRPVGILTLHHEEGRLAYLSVAVAPAARRQGLATRLYAAAEEAGFEVESVSGVEGVAMTRAGWAFAQARRRARRARPRAHA